MGARHYEEIASRTARIERLKADKKIAEDLLEATKLRLARVQAQRMNGPNESRLRYWREFSNQKVRLARIASSNKALDRGHVRDVIEAVILRVPQAGLFLAQLNDASRGPPTVTTALIRAFLEEHEQGDPSGWCAAKEKTLNADEIDHSILERLISEIKEAQVAVDTNPRELFRLIGSLSRSLGNAEKGSAKAREAAQSDEPSETG